MPLRRGNYCGSFQLQRRSSSHFSPASRRLLLSRRRLPAPHGAGAAGARLALTCRLLWGVDLSPGQCPSVAANTAVHFSCSAAPPPTFAGLNLVPSAISWQRLSRAAETAGMIIGRTLASLFFGICMRCGETSRRSVCHRCAGAEATTFITPSGLRVVSLGLYDGPNAPLIHRLKYGDETLIATRLGTALAQLLPHEWSTAGLVPVPLHAERLAERGYNQAALLARSAGQVTGQATHTALLVREKETAAQATLSRGERAHNLAGAFRATPRAFQGRIVLVDDVVTTGHTIDSCSAALEASGVIVVGVLACAVARASTTHLETKTK